MIRAMRKTKIVCTLGPATDSVELLAQLLRAGMNVARFNMAHGTHESHAASIAWLREASRATAIPVALLLDVKGPEIRTGRVEGEAPVELVAGAEIDVTVGGEPCTKGRISLSYGGLPRSVTPGTHILVADGTIDLEVLSVKGDVTRCVVRTGGSLGSRKNVNIPGIRSNLPAVTGKDIADIRFGAAQDMDYVAASFVRKAQDILDLRQTLIAEGASMHIVAKIEDGEGLANIDDIIRVADGIMIARGDLGVQLPTEEIPLAQKRIILKCHEQGKAVITATQMLDSMIANPKPTRAEATDVANAIFDGTDAVMLSGETASGKYPVQAVETMDRIARAAEDSPEYESRVRRFLRIDDIREDIAQAVTRSAFLVARDIRATAILAPTLRGSTPKLISRYRPRQVILAVTPSESVARKLLLYWGVVPLIGSLAEDSDAMLNDALRLALAKGLISNFDRIVILAGVPVNSPIMLNMIRVHFVGNVLNKGKRGFGGYASGRIVKAEDALAAELALKHDGTEILLTRFLTPDFLPLLAGLRGVVLEESSYLDWERILGVEPGLVLISSVPNAVASLEQGLTVTLHGEEFVIYEGEITPKAGA
jgi:pyruvate kinase